VPPDAEKVGAAMQIDAEALADLLAGVEKTSTASMHKTH